MPPPPRLPPASAVVDRGPDSVERADAPAPIAETATAVAVATAPVPAAAMPPAVPAGASEPARRAGFRRAGFRPGRSRRAARPRRLSIASAPVAPPAEPAPVTPAPVAPPAARLPSRRSPPCRCPSHVHRCPHPVPASVDARVLAPVGRGHVPCARSRRLPSHVHGRHSCAGSSRVAPTCRCTSSAVASAIKRPRRRGHSKSIYFERSRRCTWGLPEREGRSPRSTLPRRRLSVSSSRSTRVTPIVVGVYPMRPSPRPGVTPDETGPSAAPSPRVPTVTDRGRRRRAQSRAGPPGPSRSVAADRAGSSASAAPSAC